MSYLLATSVIISPFADAATLRNTATSGSVPKSSACVIQAVAELHLKPNDSTNDDISFECEPLDPSDTGGITGISFPLVLDKGQKKGLKDKLDSGVLVSDETTIMMDNSGITLGNGKLHVPPGREISLGKRNGKSKRRLAVVTGVKPILVVRVTDAEGKVVPQNAEQVGDDIFGTKGDPVNLKSQMSACSFNQLNITAGNPPINSAGSNEVAPGVIEVTIGVHLANNTRSTIRNAVTSAAQNKLGFNLPGPYQQVMYVLEGCYQDCGWAAYAYINSWNSVYQGPYYYMTGVQMHELGHNFNFAHSGGLDGQTYTDHTGLMGNPLYSDDVGKMCWNAAKTWQVGWYDTNKLTFDQQGSWSGTLVGIADFNNNPNNHPVVIKLETGTTTDQFVAFNRAKGVNSQNDEADDEVTIVQTGSNGEGYSQSYLQAHLVQGESHEILNWRGSGQTLTITADKIDLTANPGYADISICLGPCAAPTTSPAPSKSPTKSPTKAPTTSPAPSKSPTKSPTKTPTIFDPCSVYTRGGACRKASGCSWNGTTCNSTGNPTTPPPSPTNPTTPPPSPPTGGCSITSCGGCGSKQCKAVGCTWTKGVCV